MTKKTIINSILIIALIAAVNGFIVLSQTPEAPKQRLNTENQETETYIYPLDATKIPLATLKNKVILINFWATWCPPCIVEIPELISLKEELNDENFDIIGISMDDGSSEVLSFMKETSFNYPIVMVNKYLYKTFGPATAIPTSVLVGKNFEIVRVFQGYHSSNELKPEIKALLNRDS